MPSNKIIKIAAFVIIGVLSLAIFANSMTKDLGRDEQMYCTAGALINQGNVIYKDFTYPSQMPYHPLFYAAIYKLFNTNHYLLAGRISSVICEILILLCIVGIFRTVFKKSKASGTIYGLVFALLYVFNPTVDYAVGYAWNHDVVILLVLGSFWIFITGDFHKMSGYLRIAVIGAFLTIATFMRITTVFVYLLFLIMLLFQKHPDIRIRVKLILMFLFSSVIFSIRPIWIILQAPRAFYLNLIWIPMLYGQWLNKIGMVHDKLTLFFTSLIKPAYLVLIVVTLLLYIFVLLNRSRLKLTEPKNLLLSALLPIVFFIIAFIPPTMWRQYLAMPVPFLIISLSYPLLYLKNLNTSLRTNPFFKAANMFVIAGVIIAIFTNFTVFKRIPKLLELGNWTPIKIHNTAEDIAKRMTEPKLVLTLAPLYALEGGCEIYRQLAAGSIVYRVADYLTPDELQTANAIGPKSLAGLVEKFPPSAIIIGAEKMSFLEDPLVWLASKKNWDKQLYEVGLVVYFKAAEPSH